MPQTPDVQAARRERTLCRFLAGLAVGLSTGLHLAYLAWNCPLDLAPDEAHYWDWSRQLDWSYYSKGPLVAYLIRASCAVFGPLSQQIVGSEMLAVRLPAVLCGGLLLTSLYVLAALVFQRERIALGVIACALTLPIVSAGSSLMTIDAPYTCLWGWALVCGYLAAVQNRRWAWPAAGLLVGLGVLAKYTMILWIPSFALFLATSRAHRPLLFRRGFWELVVVAALCCAPILAWNLQHDWVTFRHVGGQAGLHKKAQGILWLGPLVYLGTQAGLYLGFWFAAWLAAMYAYRPWRVTEAGSKYLWWMSAPMFAVFLAFSLKTPEEPNWPVTAYLSGLILAARWLGEQLESPSLAWRRCSRYGLAAACGIGMAATLFVHRSDLLYPALIRVAGAPTPQRPQPLRRFDPTCRLRGWRVLAKEVDRLRTELLSAGVEAELAASSWTFPGELGFYCSGHPRVYSLGLVQGDRHSQYDIWRPNPLADPLQFQGKTFIFVGDLGPTLTRAFDSVDQTQTVVHLEQGQPLAQWGVTVCRGFKGVEAKLGERRY